MLGGPESGTILASSRTPLVWMPLRMRQPAGLCCALKLDGPGGRKSTPRVVGSPPCHEKSSSGPGAGRDVLDDVVFQQGYGHTEGAGIGIEAALVAVVAVLAIEIADGAGRLDEDLGTPGMLFATAPPAGGRTRGLCNRLPERLRRNRPPKREEWQAKACPTWWGML